MPGASERRSPAAQRHADTVRFVLFEARPAGPTFAQLVRSSELSPSQTRAGLACLRDIITERNWPPLIWAMKNGYQFCADPDQLQAYEVAVIRGKLTEIRRFITGTVAPHAALQPKGRWIKHLNNPAQFGGVHPRRHRRLHQRLIGGPGREGEAGRCLAGAATPRTPGTTSGP